MNQSKPLSELLKSKDDSEPKKQSREVWRQQRELEEARKLGNAPAAVDETGKDINPHIPQYISTVPWYVGSSGPTLKHQRPQPEKQASFSSIKDGYQRGTFVQTASKYRKGACENCGAMSHKKKDCMERPRKTGARYTNEDIAPDEIQQPDLNMDFDGKRDRWNGYDPSQYQEVVDEHRRVEQAKRHLKEQKLEAEGEDGAGPSKLNDDSDDEDKYADKIDMPGTKVDSKQRITVRNLRIREDTAKYLRNLDPDSAHYDPKTRSMRDNPYKNTGKTPDEVSFAGENFVRFTGDTKEMLQAQAFAWEAHHSGVDVHLLAEPTKAALLTKEFKDKKDQVQQSIKNSILDKYGGEEHLKVPPKELLFAQTENYVEYSRTGQIIKGAEKKIIRSKYDEDVFTNNHTTVWGSFWENFKWGYKCCHSFVKNSYCTGDAGKTVRDSENPLLKKDHSEDDSQQSQESQDSIKEHKKPTDDVNVAQDAPASTSQEVSSEKEKPDEERSDSDASESSDSGTDSSEEERRRKKKEKKKAKRKEKKRKNKKHRRDKESNDKKLAKAMKKYEQEQKQETDDRKRKYNSMYDNKTITEEDMEAFYLKRNRPEDPMAHFLNKDE